MNEIIYANIYEEVLFLSNIPSNNRESPQKNAREINLARDHVNVITKGNIIYSIFI